MQPKPKTLPGIVCGMIGLWIFLFYPANSYSQNERTTPRILKVGVMAASPLYMKTPDGRWEGFSAELWQVVAQCLNAPFEFREFSNLEHLVDALEKNEIDVFPSLPVGERLESAVDFSQSYLKSGLSIAVPAEDVESRWVHVFESFFSMNVLKAIGLLVLLSMIAGIIVWSFEKRENSEMFGGDTAGGIGHGIWWAMVTMTTVGYGDKAPKTAGGRIVALVWMIFSIVFIASFTANITTALTMKELSGKVRGFNDLYNSRVGSVSGSEGFDFLTKQGITVIPFEGVQEGVAAVAGRTIDAFVLNEQVLKYLAKKEFPGRVQVLPETYDEYFVSMALPQNSSLRKPINKALLQLMKSRNWNELRNRYIQ
ncbi:MAG TPA: transporter substrate-binding domain-containing protein [Desulfobacterales bacterium]|nr:transporter substrate-binding domain-containing protein [Desulfobacterales bacterium]